MAMMNFDMYVYGHRHPDCYGNGFSKDVVLSEILRWGFVLSLEVKGKLERYKSRLQRIIHKANQEYLNITEVNTPTHAICEYSASNKVVALYLRLLANKIMSQECNSNDINVDGLVFSYVLEATFSTLTPEGKLWFLTRLQRINVGAVEDYMGIKRASTHKTRKKGSTKNKGASTTLIKEGSSTCLTKKKGTTAPVSEGSHKEKAQGCDCTKASSLKPPTHAPSTNKKFKFSFEGVCKDLYPRSKLPEGLLLAQSIFCAKNALAFYNDKHGTEYKLVEPLSSARLYEYGVHFHCNFTATSLLSSLERMVLAQLNRSSSSLALFM
ncbi:uncharacterized protein LOC110723027 [Chenopodium quinoa]|uniref:uncharacterized protein LOC110723027 n=1 Tax=Chenopodium quinoa TaxID=63459 RepID=UPI000B790947|nr:uncharacterized protein LOC110723027 [Chenopodium quinoa]